MAGLQWDAKGYGPVEYPKLTKKTGNTLAEQGAFNDLVNISDEFYYTLQTETRRSTRHITMDPVPSQMHSLQEWISQRMRLSRCFHPGKM